MRTIGSSSAIRITAGDNWGDVVGNGADASSAACGPSAPCVSVMSSALCGHMHLSNLGLQFPRRRGQVIAQGGDKLSRFFNVKIAGAQFELRATSRNLLRT